MMYTEVKILWKFCEFLREHTMKMFVFKKKKNEIIHKRAAETI